MLYRFFRWLGLALKWSKHMQAGTSKHSKTHCTCLRMLVPACVDVSGALREAMVGDSLRSVPAAGSVRNYHGVVWADCCPGEHPDQSRGWVRRETTWTDGDFRFRCLPNAGSRPMRVCPLLLAGQYYLLRSLQLLATLTDYLTKIDGLVSVGLHHY